MTQGRGDMDIDVGIDLGQLVTADLPHGREAVEAGRELAGGIYLARALYCEDKGVGSEREWRQLARERGIPCSTMNIGLNTWADTRVALENIYESCMSRGVRPPDRFNLIAERRM